MSQSTDINTNLALEDWMYRNMDFSNHHVMMVWRNEPCVVIGRHQNPWLEANVPFLAEKEITLARRNSGGGTVYHDRGNLNITFFTPRERYDRKYNLELVKRALYRGFGIKSVINDRHDIIVQDKYKISGTAAKLGRLTGYHHCTLLVNANKADLTKALAKREHGIQTTATASTPSPVVNLADMDNKVTVEALQTAIGYEYLRTPALRLDDGGERQILKQRGFQFVNPTEDWFPGLSELKSELESWDWAFGRTPEFTVSRSFPVPAELLAPSKVYSATQELVISMTVEKGLIDDVTLNIPPGLVESGFHGEASVITHLKGKRFTSEALSALEDAMLTRHGDVKKLDDKEQFVAKCFDQVVNTI
ncbi:lipoyltransferase 1, mitochondrial isoform X3 [Pararge aegeria]|nr:lipoyltransferase 1, mitochondrial isoform X3 [Pararge aegeria]XP_039753593.1 lipoyltransferase 1, mitochondrial isoform X3 [Pararge aegeria]XP_039753602.1 lipoyltransferase 1, mitochondrial isoform X3 [Pararge aegeria]XP_039753609.1 lipoyltransferase 1, mitochondrial isoform X3 [Pararge aegeria]